MSDSKPREEGASDLPRAEVKRAKGRFHIVWIVPVLAGLAAGYLIFNRVQESGEKITISFRNVDGLKGGETPLKYRGMIIGQVKGFAVGADQQSIDVLLRLRHLTTPIAREGSRFWVVRPAIGAGSISGLATIITGPYIEVLPGQGPRKSHFVGLESAPTNLDTNRLHIVLLSNRSGALKPGSPIYYRGIEVGNVDKVELYTNAAAVEIQASIEERYARLVRASSKFWNVSGVDVKLGLFRGAEINVESLKSLTSGGIAFATRDADGPPSPNGTLFHLDDEPKKEWLEWSPKIAVPAMDQQPPQ